VDAVGACSPLLAREVAWRAHGEGAEKVARPDWDSVAAAMRAIWDDAAAARAVLSVAVEDNGDGGDGRIAAYAPYLLHCYARVQRIESISAAVRSWFAQAGRAAGTGEPEAARKRALRQALGAAQDRLRAKRFSLQRSLPDAQEADRLRRAGELLLAFAPRVEPGASVFRVPDEDLEITLDPQLSAVENAQRYFARYAKTRDAAREVPVLLAAVENDLRYLDDALVQLDLAASPGELAALQEEWSELGFTKPPKVPRPGKGSARPAQKRGRSGGAREDSLGQVARVVVGGYDVLIGRSGRGNDALLGPESGPDDIWLHARGVPGAHVLVRTRGRQPPEAVLRRAAALAAAHSQARGAGSVAVDCTVRKYVQRVKGAPPGLVTYRGERTLHVTPEP
jgi:predicted ribosome quality control (RQC) complex YloA/Tae2 family protein